MSMGKDLAHLEKSILCDFYANVNEGTYHHHGEDTFYD